MMYFRYIYIFKFTFFPGHSKYGLCETLTVISLIITIKLVIVIIVTFTFITRLSSSLHCHQASVKYLLHDGDWPLPVYCWNR